MEFYQFQSACQYSGLAYDDPDDHTRMTVVCHGNVPPGKSWGKCDKAHCPYFGVEIRDVSIYQDGKLIGKAKRGKVVYK